MLDHIKKRLQRLSLLRLLPAALLLFTVGVSYSAQASYSAEDQWVYCDGRRGSYCNVPGDQPVTVRRGKNGEFSYRYGVTNRIRCNRNNFGDPLRGVAKHCEYSFDAPERPDNGRAEALHSINPAHYQGFHEEFLAHTLSEGEYISHQNGDYRARLTSQGQLELVRMDNLQVLWSTPADPSYSTHHNYRLYLTHQGLEIRRNQDVIWHFRPGGNVSGEFTLDMRANGTLRLVDPANMSTRGIVYEGAAYEGANSGKFLEIDSGINHFTLNPIWRKLGWEHHLGWPATHHNEYRQVLTNPSYSHWHTNTLLDLLSEYNDPIKLTDLFIELNNLFRYTHILTHEEVMKTVKIIESMKNLGQMIEAIPDDLAYIFEEEVDALLAQEGPEFAEVDQIAGALEASNKMLGRHLTGQNTEANCPKLCRMLSKPENRNTRVDYIFEFAYSNMSNIPTENWKRKFVNTATVRFFVTHPRINGNGRFETEIRMRLQDFAGMQLLETGSKLTTFDSYVRFPAALSLRDVIFTYSWGKDETFVNDRRYEGAKLQSTTSAVAQGGVNVKMDQALQYLGAAGTNLLNRLSGADDTPAPIASSTANQVAAANTVAPSATESPVSDASWTFKNKLNVEALAGIGANITYDLKRLTELRPSVNNPGAAAAAILATEALGGVGLVATMYGLGWNLALFESWRLDSAVFVTNVEAMAGALIGDLIYTSAHQNTYGKNDAITAQGLGFLYIQSRDQFANYGGIAAPTRWQRWVSDSTNLSTRVRYQINFGWPTRQWFTGDASGQPDISDYGNYRFHTRYDKCLSVEPGTNRLIQESCTGGITLVGEELRRTHWMAKPMGGGFYELRNLETNYCIGIPNNRYNADNYSNLENGQDLYAINCNTANKHEAIRWKAHYTASGRMSWVSALSPNLCMDLAAGARHDGAKLHAWSCNHTNKNQRIKIHPQTGIHPDGKFTLRMADNQCVDNEAYSTSPNKGTPFVVEQCKDSGSSTSQVFNITDARSDYYYFDTGNGNRGYLDVSGVSHSDNATVHAWEYLGAQNQQWKPLQNTDGTVALMARHSKKCLTMMDSGDRIHELVQRTCDRNDINQRFTISDWRYSRDRGYDGNPDRGLAGRQRLSFESAYQGSEDWDDLNGANRWIWYSDADRAIDGITDGWWRSNGSNSVTHTAGESRTRNFWRGDLGKIQEVRQVHLYNRQDCCWDRLQNFRVIITSVPATSLSEARSSATSEQFISAEVERNSPMIVSFPEGTEGRYVFIYKEANDYLSLAEVEAHGYDLPVRLPPGVGDDSIVFESPDDFDGLTQGGTWIWDSVMKDGRAATPSYHYNPGNDETNQHYVTGLNYTVRPGDSFSSLLNIDPGTGSVQYQLRIGDNWSHRVHWGEETVGYNPSKYMGPLPAVNRWLEMRVSLYDFGIQPGDRITGVAWTTHNGGQTWHDKTMIGRLP